jgi:hypothetical protein
MFDVCDFEWVTSASRLTSVDISEPNNLCEVTEHVPGVPTDFSRRLFGDVMLSLPDYKVWQLTTAGNCRASS